MGLRGMTRWAVVGLVVAGLAGLAGLSGCGSGTSGGGAGDGDPGVPSVKEEKDLPELPLDRYEFSTRDSTRQTEAQARMTRSCMRKLGFEDFPLHPKKPKNMEAAPLIAVSITSYPYGPLDLDSARRYGYGWDPDRSPADAARPKGRVMTEAEYESFESGGCANSGAERLTEGVRDTTRMWTYVSQRSLSVDKAVGKDKRVREAIDTWGGCMESKGVERYKTPSDAYRDKAWGRMNNDGGNTDRTKKELATATADVECKREHNTAGVWWTVRAEKQRADVARHKDAYEAVRADQDRMRANVERVL